MKFKTFTLVLLGFLLWNSSFSQIVITSQNTNVLCPMQSTGAIDITVTGGVSPYAYNWSTGQTTEDLTSLSGGVNYTVTVTDSKASTKTYSTAITVPEPIAIVLVSSVNPSCNGVCNGSATYQASGGTGPYDYSNTGGAAYQFSNIIGNVTYSSLCPGTITVTVRDANNCVKYDAISSSLPSAMTLTTNSSLIIGCGWNTGEAMVLPSGGTAGYTYIWNTTPIQTTSNATGLFSGIYEVTVTDSKGCTRTTSENVKEMDGPYIFKSGVDPGCYGDKTGTVSVDSVWGRPGYNYQWNTLPVQNTATATGLSVGTYTVIVSDSFGCKSYDIKTLAEPTKLILNISQFNASCVSCSDGSAGIIVSGGTPPYSYSWNNGVNNATLTGLNTGIYCVTISDRNGCLDSTCLTIGIGNSCSANFYIEMNWDSVNFYDSSTGGTAPYSYSWNFGDGSSSNLQYPTHTYLNTGLYNVCLTITDSLFCINTHCQSITLLGSGGTCYADFNFSINGNVVNFYGISSGGTAPYTYLWDFGDSSQSNLQYPSHTFINYGQFNVCFTITDALGCIKQFCQILTLTCNTTFVYSKNGNIINFYSNSTGGTAPFTYLWDFGDSSISTVQSPSHTFLNNGQYTVCLTITDALGCIKQYCQTLTITCKTAFSYTQINSCKYMFNSSSSTGNIIFWNWNFGDGTSSTQQNPVHTYTNSGFYLTTLTTATSDTCIKTVQQYVSVSGCTGTNNGCIYGCVYQDDNLNCKKDPTEPGQTNWLLQLFDMNNVMVSSTKPGYGGCFYFSNVNPGNYIVRADPFYNWWQWDVSCPSNPDYIEVTVDSGVCDTISFGVNTPLNTIGNDLAVAVDPLGAARPGWTQNFTIGVCNKGSEIQSGKLTFIMDLNYTFTGSWGGPAPDLNKGDTLVWNFSNLNPGNCFVAYCNLNISTSTTMGQVLGYKAIAEPITGDVTPENNVDTSYVVISASYDPNDKLVTPKGTYPDGAVLPSIKEFIYTIRFQNTGNDTAFNIYVIDTLDLKVFDLSTFKILNSSHPYEVEFPGTGVVSFHFPNVLLPDSNVNERGSHGFIQYIISRKEGLKSKTAVKNKADIYFDYNPPVPTPWVINILDSALITTISKSFSTELDIHIIPNPFTGNALVKIYPKTPSHTQEKLNFKLVDLLGKEKLTGVFENDQYEIKDQQLSGGIYFYQVLNGKEMLNAGKVVVMKK